MINPLWYANGGQPIDYVALGKSVLEWMGGATPYVSPQGERYVRGPRGTIMLAPEQAPVNEHSYAVDVPSNASVDAYVARANAIKPQTQPASRASRANASKPQARPVSQATQRSSNMAYTMGPSVTTSATNIPGQVQVNLNQRHMQFADPEYQRLYALREARAREALARQGVSYQTAMNHAKNGTSY